MIGYSTVNQKGQITIPASIRKNLGIKPGMNLVITQKDKEVTVKQSSEQDFWTLRGSLKPIPVDFKLLRKSFEENLGTPKNSR
jgi:AbrB family looped-hinge helix DNA binding protein